MKGCMIWHVRSVCCLATLVRSFKLCEVYIEHGYTVVNSYQRPPQQVKATIEYISELGTSATIEHRFDKMLLLTWHDSRTPGKDSVCDSVTPRSLPQHDSSTLGKDSICDSVTPRCTPHGMLIPPTVESIIMVNVIAPDHVDDVPVVEPNQHDDVPVIPEPVLVDENEDLKEEEFKEEEEPQEEEKDDDIEVDIEEGKNEPELTYPYEEVDPLNPPPPISESEPEDVNEVNDTIESEDETVLASVHEAGESSTDTFLRVDNDALLLGLMRRDINSLFGRMASLSRRLCGHETAHALVKKKGKAKDEYYGKLILDLGNEVRSSVEQGTAIMEKLVENLGNAEEKVECKKLKKELKEARVQAHEFYQEMIRRGFMFEERPNKANDVPIEDEKSPSYVPQISPHDA
ncbi:hypothetical protein Tco_0335667 [Tanacetum coccineum]